MMFCPGIETLTKTVEHSHTLTHTACPHLTLPLHSPSSTTLLIYTHLCMTMFCVFNSWTGLSTSDIIWTISDTAWIMNILGAFLEPWVLGACIFVHLLPKFDSQTVLKVREDHLHWLIRVNSVFAHSRLLQLVSIHKTSAKSQPHGRAVDSRRQDRSLCPSNKAHGLGREMDTYIDE